jgi:membrane protease YdiL (CAAX protease family)
MKAEITSDRAEQLVMLTYKLVVHLIVPALLLRLAHGHFRDHFDAGLRRRGVLLTLVLFSAFMIAVAGLLNSIFEQLSATGLTVGAILAWSAFAWLWMTLEAGVCEEFLFRVLLQSRLSAWLGSPALAIVLTSTLFALVHVPGFYLRGGEAVAEQASSLPQIIALSIGAIAPISILFGTLWYRTRSFLLIVVVHGAIDALPAIDKLMRNWG